MYMCDNAVSQHCLYIYTTFYQRTTAFYAYRLRVLRNCAKTTQARNILKNAKFVIILLQLYATIKNK
jgi:hypothetical protein